MLINTALLRARVISLNIFPLMILLRWSNLQLPQLHVVDTLVNNCGWSLCLKEHLLHVCFLWKLSFYSLEDICATSFVVHRMVGLDNSHKRIMGLYNLSIFISIVFACLVLFCSCSMNWSDLEIGDAITDYYFHGVQPPVVLFTLQLVRKPELSS